MLKDGEKRVKVTFTSPSGNWMFSSNVLFSGAEAIVNSLSRYINKFVIDSKDPYNIRVVVPDDYSPTLVTNIQAINLEYARHGVLKLSEVFDKDVYVETDFDPKDQVQGFNYVSDFIELTDKKKKSGGVRAYKQLSLFDDFTNEEGNASPSTEEKTPTDSNPESDDDDSVAADRPSEEASEPVHYAGNDDDSSMIDDYPEFDDDGNWVPDERPDEGNTNPSCYTYDADTDSQIVDNYSDVDDDAGNWVPDERPNVDRSGSIYYVDHSNDQIVDDDDWQCGYFVAGDSGFPFFGDYPGFDDGNESNKNSYGLHGKNQDKETHDDPDLQG